MKSIQAEQAVLQCLVRDSSLLNTCTLRSTDFVTSTNIRIFEAICELDRSDQQVDIVTIAELIERRYHLNDLEFLVNLFERSSVSIGGFETYQGIVLDASKKRQAYEIGSRLLSAVESGSTDDFIGNAVRDLMALDSIEKKYHFTFKEALKNALNHIEIANNNEGLIGVSTGIDRIDDAIGGFQDSDLYIIAARPAMGKTALALNMMLNGGVAGGLISAEQGNVQAALRTIAITGSIESNKLRTANLSQDEWTKLSGTVIALQDRDLYINDKPAISITDLIRQARQWKHDHDIKILFVDYLQKIQGTNRQLPRTEQVTEVTQALKALARELDIPVVSLAQVKRIEDRADKRPKLGDMADASEIEKEADVIMTLYRDDAYNEDSDQKGIAEIDLVKNRHGKTGVVRCKFIGPYFQFKDFQSPRTDAA